MILEPEGSSPSEAVQVTEMGPPKGAAMLRTLKSPGKVPASAGISGPYHPVHVLSVKLHVPTHPWHDIAPPYLPDVCPHSSFTEQWSHTELEILRALHGVLIEEFTVFPTI